MATFRKSSKRFALRPKEPTRRAAHPVRGRRRGGDGGRSRQASVPVIDRRLLEGIARFNRHEFFACHEVLEQAWLKMQGPSRDFYKGLIQAAVAYYHWSRGNRAGAMSLYRSSRRYLERYAPEFLGVRVAEFLQRYDAVFGGSGPLGTYGARRVPVIRGPGRLASSRPLTITKEGQ